MVEALFKLSTIEFLVSKHGYKLEEFSLKLRGQDRFSIELIKSIKICQRLTAFKLLNADISIDMSEIVSEMDKLESLEIGDSAYFFDLTELRFSKCLIKIKELFFSRIKLTDEAMVLVSKKYVRQLFITLSLETDSL